MNMRKGPEEHAAQEKVRTIRFGNNGDIWIVHKSTNGIHQWKPWLNVFFKLTLTQKYNNLLRLVSMYTWNAAKPFGKSTPMLTFNKTGEHYWFFENILVPEGTYCIQIRIDGQLLQTPDNCFICKDFGGFTQGVHKYAKKAGKGKPLYIEGVGKAGKNKYKIILSPYFQ